MNFKININQNTYQWGKGSILYQDVISLAGLEPNYLYTMTFVVGESMGSLTPTQSLNVKDGMRFNVSLTNAN